ncbi:hypothetical protein L596_009548 [Steinernema carpocapsae]|uniref:Uncharacterized protein n=1 Tax=Steinernema carpocapsae TaxID=34508 RepID=A0A4U5PFN7_STECR|nr:hypothetical protein L596_009548 [Steinernema carpocapsae]
MSLCHPQSSGVSLIPTLLQLIDRQSKTICCVERRLTAFETLFSRYAKSSKRKADVVLDLMLAMSGILKDNLNFAACSAAKNFVAPQVGKKDVDGTNNSNIRVTQSYIPPVTSPVPKKEKTVTRAAQKEPIVVPKND